MGKKLNLTSNKNLSNNEIFFPPDWQKKLKILNVQGKLHNQCIEVIWKALIKGNLALAINIFSVPTLNQQFHF